MSDADTITKSKFQEKILGKLPHDSSEPTDAIHEAEYMWLGQRFRVVPMRQTPVMQFRVTLSAEERMQIKYAFVTHQLFHRQNSEKQNEISIIIRDSMRVTLAGFNLSVLDDALLMQRVIEIQSVPMMQAQASLHEKPDTPVIVDVRLEYGRFDVENRQWLPGNGFWCEREKRWVPRIGGND